MYNFGVSFSIGNRSKSVGERRISLFVGGNGHLYMLGWTEEMGRSDWLTGQLAYYFRFDNDG